MQLAGGERGGVIQGYTPVHSHVQLYLVQIILIMVLCFGLGQVVKMWNQPRVIAEVRVGGWLGWLLLLASLRLAKLCVPVVVGCCRRRCCCKLVCVAL